jgi:hypothetical protein
MLAGPSLIAIALVLAGCNHTVQATSGADYLAAAPQLQMSDGAFEERLRAAADVEPLLRFPARIGVARIGHNHCRPTLLSPSAGEGKAWLELSDRLGPGYGEFVPISPLVAAMDAPTPPACWDSDTPRDVVGTVRLAAARQYIDVVMIYEVDATADTRRNPLSIANWTVIGAFVVPSRNVKAQGVAQAMLIDVRNGYPYGTIQATADEKTSATLFAGYDAERDLMNEVKTAAVVNLTHEAHKLMGELKRELARRK